MSAAALNEARRQAEAVTSALGGYGLFGVELFIKGDTVLFSEVSPRPHDTGMVTMISQNLSQFELHVRAILGLPVPEILNLAPSASHVILAEESHDNVRFEGLVEALNIPTAKLRLFGKPDTRPGRRMGVALVQGASTDEARSRAEASAHCIRLVPQG